MIAALALALAAAIAPEAREQAMAAIEARIAMPPGAAPLSSYERLYSDGENGEIVALYQRSERLGRRWVAPNDLPLISDGGCAFIDVRVSADPDAPVSARCHGEA